MRKIHFLLILFCLAQISCQVRKKNTITNVKHIDSTLILQPNHPEVLDTLKLSQIADTVFYVNFQYKGHITQIQYLDSLFFVQDMNHIFAFNQLGELLYKIPINAGCFDIHPKKMKLYTYEFRTKEIKTFDFKGRELKCIHLKTDEEGFYGPSFLAINDTMFVISVLNNGNNKNELIFVNEKGQRVGYKKNMEPFIRAKKALTHNEIWARTLFRTDKGLRYHRCYKDTLFTIQPDMTLHPIFVEQKISKVPIDKRIECVGGDMIEYLTYCDENKKFAVRMYENNRYYIVEYISGRSNRNLSNYLIYDKETEKLNRIEPNLFYGYETHQFHFGIYNDYDGGLAFAPSYQSGDYLIMVNAGDSQGGAKDSPKELYKSGRKINNVQYLCKSGVYTNTNAKKKADAFFNNLDERENTMLMIVKLKK